MTITSDEVAGQGIKVLTTTAPRLLIMVGGAPDGRQDSNTARSRHLEEEEAAAARLETYDRTPTKVLNA